MFGELIGALARRRPGSTSARPEPFRLVELGPGRGTLMADALRATRARPGLSRRRCAFTWSRPARACARAQADRLAGVDAALARARSTRCPPGPLLLIANEFFDALPVAPARRARRAAGSSAGRARRRRPARLPPGRAAIAARPRTLPDAARRHGRRGQPGAQRARPRDRPAARRHDGGVALLIDYGAWAEEPTGDTLQAMRGHAPVRPARRARRGRSDRPRRLSGVGRGRSAQAAPRSTDRCRRAPSCARLASHLRTRKAARAGDAGAAPRVARGPVPPDRRGAMGELFKVLVLAGPDAPAPPGLPRADAAGHADRRPSLGAPRRASATASSPERAGSARAHSPRSTAATRAATRSARVEANRARALRAPRHGAGKPVHRAPGTRRRGRGRARAATETAHARSRRACYRPSRHHAWRALLPTARRSCWPMPRPA